MDLNTLRSIVTVIAFAMFMGILIWACLPSKKAQFDEAAQLPFMSDQEQGQ